MDDDPLKLFLPPVQQWFREALGEPTPPQRLGWPAIRAGQHTLILAPTGSGKTLAAFLACLDTLWRQPELPRGVRVLYISPLKALNNDIHRNLQRPLEEVAAVAQRMGQPLPPLEAAVRTGDTSTAERQRQVRRPPHILITTPESLHLLLTSRARDTLRGVTHVIVDEIHALCPNKRGVFLALLLERLEAIQDCGLRIADCGLEGKGSSDSSHSHNRQSFNRQSAIRNPQSFIRIGLSATQRPLEEVARYLGGQTMASAFPLSPEGRGEHFVPRPVTVLDAGRRKELDLLVVNPVEQFGPLPEGSIWPSIYRLLGEQVREHRSTIVFANNRRTVERITAFLNDEEDVAKAHHGSVSLEKRQQTEQALKDGRLPAVVATASLELGIDMGAVDLVCQVESPGSVARALQRVGRAGHLVGQRSKGRLIPKTTGDLLEQAVLAREMAAGRVEEMRVPINCLDILAQQLVAMTAMDAWSVPDLHALVRQAYPYRDLSPQAFETTLEMVSGRYRFRPLDGEPEATRTPTLDALQPRISWDRVHNRLLALPGTHSMALVNGGTIPDTGEYAAYATNGTRIGELDEEFIYERRVGDTFLLGTNAWRLERIEADRVIVSPAEGTPAMLPFWRGENAGRTYDLGHAIGAFLRELQPRLGSPDVTDWLQRECFLDAAAAQNLRHHVVRQLLAAGCLPTDETVLIEASRDQLGDWQTLLLSPLGHRLHLTLRLALEAMLRQRLGYHPQCMHHDDGVLFRFTDMDEPLVDLFAGLTAQNVEELVLSELADSALFALRFRQNAARAMLMPRGQPGRRAPLWLQRMRGRDLLQVARQHPDFPVVAETFRECLHDHLDVPRLQTLLDDIRQGRVRVVTRRAEVPSPFAGGVLLSFNMSRQYQYDGVEPEGGRTSALDRQMLEQLIAPNGQPHLLDPRAIRQVERRLRGLGQPPRSVAEMAEWLRRLGDLTTAELEGPMASFVEQLHADGRAVRLELPRVADPMRWICIEEETLYRKAFGLVVPSSLQRSGVVGEGATGEMASSEEARQAAIGIFRRFLETHALVGLADVLARYPFEETWARRQLDEWAGSGRAVAVGSGPTVQWSAPANLEQVQRGSLALLRREVLTCPAPQFADFLLRWQGVHPETQRGLSEGLNAALERLEGLPLPSELWERVVLPVRVPGYQPRWLDEWIASGAGVWVGQGSSDGTPDVAFLCRESLGRLSAPLSEGPALPEDTERVLELLRLRGAQFLADLAVESGLSPSAARSGLWTLIRRSLVTNDRFDVIRQGEGPAPAMTAPASTRAVVRLPSLRDLRRGVDRRTEGRWSALSWGRPEPEAKAVFQARLLLERYGIVAREMALLDPWMPPWRVLYEVLSRMELAGDVRRGYFVEGLSGAQFALPEASQMLQDLHLPSTATAPAVLLHSIDPANLYGSAAPFDIPLLEGGTRPFARRPSNWLVLRAGLPVLLIEQQGKRVTALPSASRDDLRGAVARLGGLANGPHGGHKLVVEEWNGRPVTTTDGRELLEEAGFVRDYQAMTLYAAWR
jgi:ATP-dependent Lhr-like helicase